MAIHTVPVSMMSEEEHRQSLSTQHEKEAIKFIQRVAKRVLRLLRESPERYPKDPTTIRMIEGLLRQNGVPGDRTVIAQLVYEEYCGKSEA